MLQILEEKLNFHSELLDGHQLWGTWRNGHWTGTVGMVVNHTADLAMCGISRNLQRSLAIDFSHFTVIDEIAFISKSPSVRTKAWMIAEPFSWQIWLGNLVSYFVVVLSLYVLYQFQPQHSIVESHAHFRFITIRVFSVAVNQSSYWTWSKSIQIRFVYAGWMLAVLVLTTSYSGLFYSSLTVPAKEPPIDTLQKVVELISTGRYFVLTNDDGSVKSFFTNANPLSESIYAIGQHLNKTKEKMFNNIEMSIDVIQKDSHKIYVDSRFGLEYAKIAYARMPVHIGIESIALDFMGLIFPRNSTFYQPFNIIITEIYEMGFFAHWDRQVNMRAATVNPSVMLRHLTAHDQKIAPLGLHDLYSVALLWIFGILLSTVICALEMLSKRTIRKTRKKIIYTSAI